MRCHHPFYTKDRIGNYIPHPCGRCPYCKKRRVNSWVFRLLEEEKSSSSSYFITLTYDNNHIPRTKNGYNTLLRTYETTNKKGKKVKLPYTKSFSGFMKRLRKYEKNTLKYYACGEYGTKNLRPHYHAIIFNLQDIENVRKAWQAENPQTGKKEQIGTIHIGTVTGDSIAYTAKYIDKRVGIPLHKNDDRLPEFSLMSKGLGNSFLIKGYDKQKKPILKQNVLKYYKSDLSRMYVTLQGGAKTAMPRYYREMIFTDQEKLTQRGIIHGILREEYKKEKEKFDRMYKKTNFTFEEYLESQKLGELHQFNQSLKKRK